MKIHRLKLQPIQVDVYEENERIPIKKNFSDNESTKSTEKEKKKGKTGKKGIGDSGFWLNKLKNPINQKFDLYDFIF